MTQKIIKTGNSAALTIPSKFLRALNLNVGDKAEAEMDFQKAKITYRFPNARQLSLGVKKKSKKGRN